MIGRELGRGQMGHVFLAEDAVLARPVAIKFIAGLVPDLAARQRFLMEARTAARIQHPNVVAVYRVGELEGRPYIVSELVRGSSLADLPRPMAWTKALDLGIELARGLAAAHRRGVVHCDLKPANAMVTHEGIAKLVDFGLARLVVEGADEGTGPLAGTPDYMAPEVWAGRAPTRRSDVYSLGAVLFELVAGRPPFAERDARELATAGVAPDLKERVASVDGRFARVVARCLERDPEARYPSGEELREALELLHPSRARLRGAGDENPYRGLRAFESAQRSLFFGRGLEVGTLIERLRVDPVVIVAGDSGVGKSSLLRAGVIPAVLEGALGAGRTWEAITMTPGRRPLLSLATALGEPAMAARILADPDSLPRELRRRAGDQGVILFVDQMEELVTVGDAAEVAALELGLARISEGVPGVRLVTTLRADFLSRIAALPRLGRELSRLLYFVAPLPPDRLRDVITGPAAATGMTFESEELISTLVETTAEAGGGGLPLLSFALAELWEARDLERAVITTAALQAMGGVAGALARHGDAVLAQMSAAVRADARRVLLRLVTSVGTRVRRTESELAARAGAGSAIDVLVKGRLLVVQDGDGSPTYELAHEVLVRGWGTLREWLDDDAENRAHRERLAEAAAEWDRQARRDDLTWNGPRLAEATALESTTLTERERGFLGASRRAVRRRVWLRRGAVAGVIALLVSAFAVQRYFARRQLAHDVGVEVDAATTALAAARTAAHEEHEAAALAFERFDAGDGPAGETLWRQVRTKRDARETAFATAGGRLEAALAKDATRTDVRALLADALYERAVFEDSLHDDSRRDELIARLAAYDTNGTRRARWNTPGHLRIHAPPDATIRITPGVATVLHGDSEISLPAGSYGLELAAPGRAPVRAPVVVTRGDREVSIAMPLAGSFPAGYVYIPAGAFLYGSKADDDARTGFFAAVPMHERTTPAYLIGRTEVTVADWIEYVQAQPTAAQDALLPKLPLTLLGGFEITRDGTSWRATYHPRTHTYSAAWGEDLVYAGRVTHERQDWRRFPITGVSALEVEQYAVWLDRTGRLPGARLCTEVEWERAARGADGRDYPLGDQLGPADANIDSAHGQDLMGLDEVGLHTASTSPFWLVDTAGNAFEWSRADGGGYVLRGASYFYDRKTANLANRQVATPDLKDANLGVRLCGSAPHVAE